MNRHCLIAALLVVLAGCNREPDEAANSETASSAPGKPATQAGASAGAKAPGARAGGNCADLPGEDQLHQWLKTVPGQGEAGGLASGRFEWAAVVDRDGELCAIAVAPDDATAAWPGSQAIAKAKAYTANAFSTDGTPMSTARLYTMAQPGHSLYGAGAANPFNPECLSSPTERKGVGKVCGGTIVFGGGLPLYRANKKVGGLGVSGDTPCADHEIAKRLRAAAQLEPPQGASIDDIQFREVDGASLFSHPLCANTWRNGKHLGEERPARP